MARYCSLVLVIAVFIGTLSLVIACFIHYCHCCSNIWDHWLRQYFQLDLSRVLCLLSLLICLLVSIFVFAHLADCCIHCLGCIARWFKTITNRDVSTGLLVCPFTHSLPPLARLLARLHTHSQACDSWCCVFRLSWALVHRTVGWNCMKLTRSFLRQKPLSHWLRNEWISKSVNQLTNERASEASSVERSKWVSGASEQANGRANGPVLGQI